MFKKNKQMMLHRMLVPSFALIELLVNTACFTGDSTTKKMMRDER